MGITRKSKIHEVQRPELVGRYLGETAQRTKECIDKAKGGVLFVDEAYRLKVDSEKDYGKEALDTLMEEMLKGNPVMIFAGYPVEMEAFMGLNPGFKRRIRSIFYLDDYTSQELADIFSKKVKQQGFRTDVSAEELATIIDQQTTVDFRKQWNAGLCDRLFELAKENLDQRLMPDSFGEIPKDDDSLSLICKEDIVKAIESMPH